MQQTYDWLWPVGALGHPESSRALPQDALGGAQARADLRPGAHIVSQQGQVPMGGTGTQDLDSACFPVGSERPRNVLADALKILDKPIKMRLPVLGQPLHLGIPPSLELLLIGQGLGPAVAQPLSKAPSEAGAMQLLKQDRGQPQAQACVAPSFVHRVDGAEQGQPGLRSRFKQPLLTMGPVSVPQHVGQVPMKDHTEATDRHALTRSCHCGPCQRAI